MLRKSTYGANPYNTQRSYSSASPPYSNSHDNYRSYNRSRRNYNQDYYSEQNTCSTDTYHENTYNDDMLYYDNGLYDDSPLYEEPYQPQNEDYSQYQSYQEPFTQSRQQSKQKQKNQVPVQKVKHKTQLKQNTKKKHKLFNSYCSSAFMSMMMLGAFGFFVFPGNVVEINGTSMLPNLQDGDKVFASSFPKNIDRFDIVIVSNQNTEQISDDAAWIKRVIGLPGEKVEVRDNKLYINDKRVKEPFETETSTDDFGPVVLSDDEYWVMGDNRANSCDSRYVGVFKKRDIKFLYRFNIKELSKKGSDS